MPLVETESSVFTISTDGLRQYLEDVTLPAPDLQAQLDRIESKLDRIITRMFSPEELEKADG